MFESLTTMASYYQKKKPPHIEGKIHLVIGEDNHFLIKLEDDNVEVEDFDTENRWDLSLMMSEKTFEKLNSGEWNGMTAVGRSSMSESAPLDFRIPEGEQLNDETLQMMYHFLVHFFSKDYPTVTELGRKHSRKVHGGNAVPIAYGDGIRSAYYTIKKGEQINEDEEDPWDQVFTVIGGSGKAFVDGEEIELKKNISMHVPPNTEHIIKKEKGDDELELLWIAYGEKA
ncbi:MAG: cupin domain-containing protein [Candidatus Thermoplasmatota archaeon]